MRNGRPIPLPNSEEAKSIASSPIDPVVSPNEIAEFPAPRGPQDIGETGLTDLVAENAALREEIAERDARIATLTSQKAESDAQLAEYKRLYAEAQTDTLMGIATKAKFEAFKSSLEKGTTSIDLDNNHLFFGIIDVNLLKRVNDTDGHLAGDAVLKHTGQGIAKAIAKEKLLGSIRHVDEGTGHSGQADENRHKDSAYRIGGDEIALVLVIPKNTDKPAEQILTEISQRIRSNISEGIKDSFVLSPEAKTYAGKVSMGFAEFHIGDNVEVVVDIADKAMYEEKERSKRPQITSSIGGIAIDPQGESLLDKR